VQEISKNYDEQTASQAVIDDAIADEVITEEEADAEVEEAKETANNTEEKNIDAIIDELPF
jgi:hypothetical protein